MRVNTRASRLCCATLVAALPLLCLPMAWSRGQRTSAPRPAPAQRQRYEAPRAQNVRPQQGGGQRYERNIQQRPQQFRGGAAGNQWQRQPGAGAQGLQPYRGQGYNQPSAPAGGQPGSGFRAPYNSVGPPAGYGQQGHLGSWLNQHRGVPVQQQEQMLRNDPSFSRLPQPTQQRLVQQLHQVDQMPQAQRDRRLARNENLERMTPQQRAQVQASARQWTQLPADRQAAMRGAFRDLRGVPSEQRSTVLSSGQYQRAFSPEERGILSNMLSAEPYEPAQK